MVVVVVDGAAGPVKPNVPDRNLLVLVGGPLPLLLSCFVAMIVNGVNVLERPERPERPGSKMTF